MIGNMETMFPHFAVIRALGLVPSSHQAGLLRKSGFQLMDPRRTTNHLPSSRGAQQLERLLMTEVRREPILRLMPGPGDINANGHIFGGWVLSQMDKAGGIIARLQSGGPVATVAIDRMEFIAPIHLRDLISVYAEIENVGRTSMKVRIEVMAWRDSGAVRIKVTEGLFTFVAIDDQAQPRPVAVERSITLETKS